MDQKGIVFVACPACRQDIFVEASGSDGRSYLLLLREPRLLSCTRCHHRQVFEPKDFLFKEVSAARLSDLGKF